MVVLFIGCGMGFPPAFREGLAHGRKEGCIKADKGMKGVQKRAGRFLQAK